MKTLINRWIASVICAAAVIFGSQAAEPTVLYSTQFEASEGFSQSANLAGQNGWDADANDTTYWNGLLENIFDGYGQQGYIGFVPLPGGLTSASVWKANLPTVPVNQQLVQFSTLMAVLDSTTGYYDDFRWAVYNKNVDRLFTLDFDNHALEINYALDDGNGFISTGKTFEPNKIYELVITMDVARNRWSARLDDVVLVTEQPMTTQAVSLAIGDVDAVWSIRDAAHPGDNYMAFDNYSIIAYANAVPPTLTNVSHLPDGSHLVRLTGEPNRRYVLEATANLQTWTPIKTNSPPDGVFEHLDMGAIGQPRRFYRAKVE